MLRTINRKKSLLRMLPVPVLWDVGPSFQGYFQLIYLVSKRMISCEGSLSNAFDFFNLSIDLSFQFAWEVIWVNKNTKAPILSSFFFLNYWIITFFILQILLTQFWFYILLILWFQFSTVLRLATLNDGWLILVKLE